jgi:hypothetical protein
MHIMAHTCAIPCDGMQRARLPGWIQCLRAAIPPRPTRIRPYGLVASLRAIVFRLRDRSRCGMKALHKNESFVRETGPIRVLGPVARLVRPIEVCMVTGEALPQHPRSLYGFSRWGLVTTPSGALRNAQVGRKPGSRRARPARTWRKSPIMSGRPPLLRGHPTTWSIVLPLAEQGSPGR